MDHLTAASACRGLVARFRRIAGRYPGAALALEHSLAHPEGPARLAAGAPAPLGALARRAGRISATRVDEALAEQRSSGGLLGEVLVRRGDLHSVERDALLRLQRYQRGELPAAEVLRLGSILEGLGRVTRKHLEEALAAQAVSGRKLGEELVAAGRCTPQDVALAISLQERLVSIVAALALCVAAGAMAPLPAEAASARITVSAVVTARARIDAVRQVASVEVSRADIQRGYVEVPSASRFELRSNSPSEVTLIPSGSWFSSATVSGLPQAVRVGAQADAHVLLPLMRDTYQADLSVRFELAPGVAPGSYPWPLAIRVTPI